MREREVSCMRIVAGILLVALGAALVIKAEWFYQNFGEIGWAQAHLGAEGGSRLMYKLIGLALVIIGFLVMTGLIGGILLSVFKPILPQ